MICITSEIEIEVLYKRIKNQELNLQPSFQRGEVWSPQKQKRLIDSILRDWKIPPIHVVIGEDYKEEVLDGQQRLAAIRDFIENEIKIDGSILPENSLIKSLDGLIYGGLTEDLKRKFNRFSLTKITLKDYKADEPAELFYRLNQPATLTSAEQRNAYVGVPRNQVKKLVDIFEKSGAKSELIGFSNSRLAYDEVVSKLCVSLEKKTLRKKITSNDMSIKYRSEEPFDNEIIKESEIAIRKFMESITEHAMKYGRKLALNKATLYSWLIFSYKNLHLNEMELAGIVFDFEILRQYIKGKETPSIMMSEIVYDFDLIRQEHEFIENMFLLFNQRASMGSTDALSIIYRDIILEIFRDIVLNKNSDLLNFTKESYRYRKSFPLCLDDIYNTYTWGAKL